jgi:hypothetical protein
MTKFFTQDTGVFRTDELVILNENGVAVFQSVADENGLHDNKGVLEIIDYIAALEARLQEATEVIKSGQILVLKMFEVYDDPQYQAAFSLLYDHQGKYSGKKWTEEQNKFTELSSSFLNHK